MVKFKNSFFLKTHFQNIHACTLNTTPENKMEKWELQKVENRGSKHVGKSFKKWKILITKRSCKWSKLEYYYSSIWYGTGSRVRSFVGTDSRTVLVKASLNCPIRPSSSSSKLRTCVSRIKLLTGSRSNQIKKSLLFFPKFFNYPFFWAVHALTPQQLH